MVYDNWKNYSESKISFRQCDETAGIMNLFQAWDHKLCIA